MIGRQHSGGSWWALVGAATLSVFLAGAAQAATINVPADYPTIQAAVNSATSGDTIHVAAGTYTEQVTITRSLDLIGAGEGSTTILAPAVRIGSVTHGGTAHDYLLAAYATSGTIDVRVQGFTLDVNAKNKTAGTARLDGVFFRDVKNAGGTMAGLFSSTIHNFAATPDYESWGVAIFGDSLLTVNDNDISDYTRDGLIAAGGTTDPNVTISGNTITGSGSGLNGIGITDGVTGSVTGNTVTGNTRSAPWAGVGIGVWSDDLSVTNNDVNGNYYGIDIGANGATVSGNRLLNNISRAISLTNSDNNTVKGNTITGPVTGTDDVAIGLADGSTGNMIGGTTSADGNTITMATSGTWAPASPLLYAIHVGNSVGAGSNTIRYNTITGGKRGIQIDGGNTGTTTIADNTISNTPTAPEYPQYGIGINGGTVNITSNTITNSVRPIESWGGINLNITGNTINGSTYDGINLGNVSGSLAIADNTIYNVNEGSAGISCRPDADDPVISGNEIYNCWKGILIGSGCTGAEITNNNIHNNNFSGMELNEIVKSIIGNTLADNWRGIESNSPVNAHFNNLLSHAYGSVILHHGGPNDLENNWWGDTSGPNVDGTGPGTGSAVVTNGNAVDYTPWIEAGVEESTTRTVTGGGTVSTPSGDAEAVVSGAGSVQVTVARYDGNPTGSGLGTIEVGYIDVYVPDTIGVTQIEVRLFYAAGTDTSTLRLHWWNGTAWVECSNQGVNIAGGFLWAIITAGTVPSLTDLHGTIFGGGSASIWYEDFEYTGQAAMVTAGWVFGTNGENLWHHASQASVPAIAYSGLTPFPSIDHAVWFAHPSTAQYSSGSTNGASVSPQAREAQALVQPKGAGEGYPYGELTSPSINVSGFAGLTVSVSFRYFREVECYALGSYDRTYAQARFGGGPWQTIWTRDSKVCTAMESWQATGAISVVVPAGATTMQIRFVFDAVDNVGNGYLGWLIDDLEILQQQNPGPGPSPLAIATNCPLPGGTVSQSYDLQLQASGGTGPYTWTATGLPTALTCTTAGVVSGTPDTAGTYPSVVLTVTDSATQTASKTCSLTIAPVSQDCPWCDLALLNFENALTDQKLAPLPWTVTGLWHVATNGCANCGTTGSNHYGYFGKDASCSYDNAGVAVTGYLTSPEISLASCIQNLAIGLKHYREVEAFPGPGSYDRTSVQVRWLNAGGWGAWQTIWLKDSTNPSPDYCLDVVIGPVAVPTGATKAQVRFGFESVDGVFNNFMGWAVDEIWVKNSTCVSGPATAPLSLSGLQVKDVSRAGITVLNVPNPVRDVHTTTFSVRGVGIEAVRIQIFDINQNLVFEEEVAGTELVWHTVDAYGEYLANGVYFYRALVLASGQWMATGFEKLVILR